jgi:hypothetical protein
MLQPCPGSVGEEKG